MFQDFIARLVERSVAHARGLLLLFVFATGAIGYYAATHLTMDSNTANMISPDLPWKRALNHFNELFPNNTGLLVVVVDGRTPDLAEDSAAHLAARLSERSDLFYSVRRADGGPFFDRFGLLMLPVEDLEKISASIIRAQPFIASLAADPSLRGLFDVLSLALEGVKADAADISTMEKPLTAVSSAISNALAGDHTPMSWRSLMINRPIEPREMRKLILTQPKRDFTSLRAGASASLAIRAIAQELGLTAENGVKVRLTGPVALNDDEFSTVTEGMGIALVLSILLVIGLLFIALRSLKLVFTTFVTLIMGLILTLGFAAVAIGSLNVISVAFAVMFIGLSIDFGIQFGVRYGQERFEANDNRALVRTGHAMAKPLTLAALAIAGGFLGFTPTDYRGVSELGLIAGAGMAITLILNLTLLPALLSVLQPKGRPEDMGFAWAKRPDEWLQRRRWFVVGAWIIVAAFGAYIARGLSFDFNPLHLKDRRVESVATMFDLMNDPLRVPYGIEIVAPNIEAARETAKKLNDLPEVYAAITADSFVPKDQEEKLAIIADLSDLMSLSLNPLSVAAKPDNEQISLALRKTASQLRDVTASSDFARQLARLLDQAADSGGEFYPVLDHVLLASLPGRLNSLRTAMTAEPITVDTLPPEIRSDWIASTGEARIAVFPEGNSNENAVLLNFVRAVSAVASEADLNATGPAIQIYEAGQAVSHAFWVATVLALIAMAVLLFIVLRRVPDVLMVLVPLVVAALTTVGLCGAIDLQLNFANIIALPLLLGIGVAFNIYFVINWRKGVSHPLQTSTARGVLFSALATGASFGSLALSSHAGTSGLGVLLLTGLGVILAGTFTFLPALLGPAPQVRA